MAASIARKFATILVAVAVVGSMAVGPALADDDGEIDVSGDGVSVGGDDGTTVSAGDDGSTNGSSTVSADADADGADTDVSVSGGDGSGTDGAVDCDVSTGTQDPTDACESSATGGDGDSDGDSPGAPSPGDSPEAPDTGDAPEAPDTGADQVPDVEIPEEDAPEAPGGGDGVDIGSREVSTPDEPVEAPDLPVSYTDDVPFEAFPPFCKEYVSGDDVPQPVDPTDPVSDTPVNKSQLPKEAQEPPSTPVGNPIGLVSAPINQCTVFNPYSPQVNPTDPPDDPGATVSQPVNRVSTDRVFTVARTEATTGEDGPGSETTSVVLLTRHRTFLNQDAEANDGSSDFGGDVMLDTEPTAPNRTQAASDFVVFGKTAGASLTCDGSKCKPKASGVPSGNAVPAIPTGGSDDGGQPEPDPSADTGQPELVDVGQDGAVIVDDRRASLGDGLPGGDSETVIIGGAEDGRVEQDGDADSGQGNGANTDVRYERGAYPGDDDGKAAVKADNGAGVVVRSDCQDYDCDTSGTGLYAPRGGLPVSPPGGAPSPGALTQTLLGLL